MVIESLYRLGLQFRHLAYDKGWFASETPPICTVSIGNIVIGGSGKTPIVQKIAKEFTKKYKVAIALRGYLGTVEHLDKPILVTPETEAALCGDEALVHAVNLPDVSVWAGKSRVQASRLAANHGAEVLLLDDGMQHRKLKRDVEIVVVDAQDDLKEQKLLPFGRLRDLPERLRYADAVILHNAKEEWPDLKTFTDAPVVATRMEVSKDTAAFLNGKKIAYFCGIGRPERFEETLLALGATIAAKYWLRDHAAIDPKQLSQFCIKAKDQGAEVVVCTQKDFVKLQQTSLELPLHVVQAEALVIGGELAWNNLLKSIMQKIQQRKQES